MARPLLLRIFTDELPIKVLSMVLAVTLFVLVRNDKDATSGAYVKVIYTMPEDRVLVSDPVPEIKVSVRGPWTKLQHLDRSLEPIRIDLQQRAYAGRAHRRGRIKLPAGVRVSSIVPSEVHVEFEPRVMREVPVQPILEGQPADGYRVARVAAEPARVKVDGAKSVVDALERMRRARSRSPTRAGRSKARSRSRRRPCTCRFAETTTVSVRADVEAAMVERTFEELPIKRRRSDAPRGDARPAERAPGHPRSVAARR